MTTAATFLFADIAGFTALTEAHGDDEAAALVDRFECAVAAAVPEYGAHRVKSIGDAVMVRVPAPGAAIALGLRLASGGFLGDHGSPAVRVGMHHGTAICRDGDYFGSAVNLAARVSALAAGGDVLLTAQTAAAAGGASDVVFEARGRHELKGIAAPVEVVAAVRPGTGSPARVIDPVCRMAVTPERAAGWLVHRDRAYHFCALGCAAAFARHPERFAS